MFLLTILRVTCGAAVLDNTGDMKHSSCYALQIAGCLLAFPSQKNALHRSVVGRLGVQVILWQTGLVAARMLPHVIADKMLLSFSRVDGQLSADRLTRALLDAILRESSQSCDIGPLYLMPVPHPPDLRHWGRATPVDARWRFLG